MANTQLKPEYLTNYEAGGDFKLFEKLLGSVSLYYSVGKDFLYYVNSGDSIDMGTGNRPIYLPQNITGVEIYGTELELSCDLLPMLNITANYAYAHSQIKDFNPAVPVSSVDLTGKYLVDVPANMLSVMAAWRNRIVNVSIAGKFTGKRWVNDLNQYDDIVGAAEYPAYTTIDMRLWKDISHFFIIATVQNIFDVTYFDSKTAVCPGRFITLEAGVKF
jgi:iron complex outermembrane receptor protein